MLNKQWIKRILYWFSPINEAFNSWVTLTGDLLCMQDTFPIKISHKYDWQLTNPWWKKAQRHLRLTDFMSKAYISFSRFVNLKFGGIEKFNFIIIVILKSQRFSCHSLGSVQPIILTEMILHNPKFCAKLKKDIIPPTSCLNGFGIEHSEASLEAFLTDNYPGMIQPAGPSRRFPNVLWSVPRCLANLSKQIMGAVTGPAPVLAGVSWPAGPALSSWKHILIVNCSAVVKRSCHLSPPSSVVIGELDKWRGGGGGGGASSGWSLKQPIFDVCL